MFQRLIRVNWLNSCAKTYPVSKSVGAPIEEFSWVTLALFTFTWADDLEDVPGIGPANKECLEEYGIKTPKQLLGQFLLLKDPDLTIQEHCDEMFHWLTREAGVRAAKATIIRSLGQKASTMIPGIYDEEYVVCIYLYSVYSCTPVWYVFLISCVSLVQRGGALIGWITVHCTILP